ncbi:hypothetical protein Tco_0803174 [Tanacetum coccineum]|uniref:Uncharacterized protein n=1 Tax=Tanacetum coccineum TaxID=301880 RepID=A0ABQ5A3C2_9ASTR
MEQMTTLRDLVGQVIQKKEEEKRIAEEQAAKGRYWKIPICYDDDEDNTTAITPVLPIEEPDVTLKYGGRSILNYSANGIGRSFQRTSLRTIIDYNDDSSSCVTILMRTSILSRLQFSTSVVEIVSLEVVEIVDPEIDALRDNPTPSSEVVIKSTSTFPNLFLEETNTFDNSIPESETFRFNLEEISSGSPTTHSELSLPDY